MVDLAARRPDFAGQNLFLQAVLGLVSASRGLGGILARHSDADGASAPIDVASDPALAAALGVVALRERLLLHLASALSAPPPIQASEPPAAASPRALRPLLR